MLNTWQLRQPGLHLGASARKGDLALLLTLLGHAQTSQDSCLDSLATSPILDYL